MNVQPIRDFIVVAKEEAPKQTASGLYIAPSVEERVISGKVLAVGSGFVTSTGTVLPLEVKAGDRIAFNKNMAVEVKSDDDVVLLLREEHVLCVLKA